MLSDTKETEVSCFLPGTVNIKNTLKKWEKEDQILYLRHHSGFFQPLLYAGFHIILQEHTATRLPGVKPVKQLTGMNTLF